MSARDPFGQWFYARWPRITRRWAVANGVTVKTAMLLLARMVEKRESE